MLRCLLWLALLAPGAHAAEIAPCLDCHRSQASGGLAPQLDGQHREYLQIQLTRFREHMRPAFPMQDLAQGLDDERIAELASAFAERDWPAPPERIDAAAVSRGAALAEGRDCVACHGHSMHGGGSIPRLAGQSPGYLAQQLRQFAAGERHHPPAGGGQRMQSLAPGQAEDLAQWLASLP